MNKLWVRQEVRYLIAGGWNTVFGLGILYLLLWLFCPARNYTPRHLLVQSVSLVLGVTMSYTTYKLFVFRTKGNALREYYRTWIVYGISSLYGLLALPVCMKYLGINQYLAVFIIAAVAVLGTFIGHKHFAFRR